MKNHRFLRVFVVLGFLVISAPALWAQSDTEAGAKLFRQHCAACHKVDKALVGPKMEGVSEKYADDREWLYKWIQNSPGLIQSGDEKAVALFEANNSIPMTAFPSLTDDDIENILVWVDADVAAKAAPPEVAATGSGAAPGSGEIDGSLYTALMLLVVVLIMVAVLLIILTATLVTAVRAKEQKDPFSFADVWTRAVSMLQNKFVITAVTALILVMGTAKFIAEARTIGLNQGYMPEQPIAYSHVVHAGINKIDCEYCHSGVTKSKNAWIPSVNVCMNCHKYIDGSEIKAESGQLKYSGERSPEIAKIYAAAGWDPDAQAYSGEPKAIEWVRIHNLPDHAYFNHAQHVVVGKLECQTCHGQVQEMEQVYQYSDLGMGWCVDCHRTQKVKHLGKETDYTVEDMGGLDCMRCHY